MFCHNVLFPILFLVSEVNTETASRQFQKATGLPAHVHHRLDTELHTNSKDNLTSLRRWALQREPLPEEADQEQIAGDTSCVHACAGRWATSKHGGMQALPVCLHRRKQAMCVELDEPGGSTLWGPGTGGGPPP